MHYKALMLDVDGTLVPYDYNAVPSDKVADAVKKASDKVLVCLVTGRSFGFITRVLEKCQLTSGYAVVIRGAQVLDLVTKEFLYDQPIEPADAEAIVTYMKREHIPFYLKQDTFAEEVIGQYYTKDIPEGKSYMAFTDESLSERQVDAILTDFSEYPDLTLNKGHHKERGRYSVNICHTKATKLHGIETVLKKTGITKEEVIAIGDGYNDFPLLMAAGLKVAMGNAVPELKTVADIIAPSVEEDGVAAIIEKYILKNPLPKF